MQKLVDWMGNYRVWVGNYTIILLYIIKFLDYTYAGGGGGLHSNSCILNLLQTSVYILIFITVCAGGDVGAITF